MVWAANGVPRRTPDGEDGVCRAAGGYRRNRSDVHAYANKVSGRLTGITGPCGDSAIKDGLFLRPRLNGYRTYNHKNAQGLALPKQHKPKLSGVFSNRIE